MWRGMLPLLITTDGALWSTVVVIDGKRWQMPCAGNVVSAPSCSITLVQKALAVAAALGVREGPFAVSVARRSTSIGGEHTERPTGPAVRFRQMEQVEIRRSSLARRWRLEVPWGAPARLTVPVLMRQAELEQVLAEQRQWIEQQRAAQVPKLGLEHLGVSESEGRVAARELISAVADEEARKMGVAFRRVRIGSQRTLWGSCSARGVLAFNWRLVIAPYEVLDYVVVHELCHLRVLNHSRRFWSLVERQRPEWRRQRDWLRTHGPELLALKPMP
jgi:predicted metal-dependent hydrolase